LVGKIFFIYYFVVLFILKGRTKEEIMEKIKINQGRTLPFETGHGWVMGK
jgi:hypothetical protein